MRGTHPLKRKSFPFDFPSSPPFSKPLQLLSLSLHSLHYFLSQSLDSLSEGRRGKCREKSSLCRWGNAGTRSGWSSGSSSASSTVSARKASSRTSLLRSSAAVKSSRSLIRSFTCRLAFKKKKIIEPVCRFPRTERTQPAWRRIECWRHCVD